MNYLDGLNPAQYHAVTHMNGPILVIAGPGSGKTRVLTLRIAHLVKQGIPPYQILALTFTNKAAKEMKERIAKVAGEQANQIWAGTFHSIFARILRAEAEKIGFPSSFSIYDPSDAKSLITEIVKGQGLDTKVYQASAIYHTISMAKNNLISPAQYATNHEYLLADKQRNMPYLYKIYAMYVQRCQKAGALDFDDLLYQMHRLLAENPDNTLEKYRQKFKYILVDEYQDTNQLQYSIVQYLVNYPGSPRNICVVGDDAQSIYAFRGATIQNILNFEKDFPDLTVYKLEQNYRSTHFIVQAANDIIAKNSKQLRKRIFTEKGQGERIQVIRAVTENDEARLVVERLVEQKHRNQLKHSDFAILYRTNAQSRVFEEALKSHRIPYKVYGGMSFYERKEVKDSLAYLRVVVNPLDEEALRRIINYPARGIGDTSVQKLLDVATRENVSFWQVLKEANQHALPKAAINSIANFVKLIEVFQGYLQKDNAYDLAKKIIKHSGIEDELKKDKTQEGKERIDNVEELLNGIKNFAENDELTGFATHIEDKTLASYLQNVLLLTDVQDEESEQNRVRLMSVHAAKGLEFPSVFVVGLEENLFPSMQAIKSTDRSQLEEERRLFYVAITRAERFLTLTYATGRYRFGKHQYNSSSRFLEEIQPDNLDMGGNVATAKVTGLKAARPARPMVQSSNLSIQASPIEKIVGGVKVLHERFGKGKVIAVEGKGDDKIAVILFDDNQGEKRIVLRFAKLQIIN